MTDTVADSAVTPTSANAEVAVGAAVLDPAVLETVRHKLLQRGIAESPQVVFLDLDPQTGVAVSRLDPGRGAIADTYTDAALTLTALDRDIADHLIGIARVGSPNTPEWRDELFDLIARGRERLKDSDGTFLMGQRHIRLFRMARRDVAEAGGSLTARAEELARAAVAGTHAPAVVIADRVSVWPGLRDAVARAVPVPVIDAGPVAAPPLLGVSPEAAPPDVPSSTEVPANGPPTEVPPSAEVPSAEPLSAEPLSADPQSAEVPPTAQSSLEPPPADVSAQGIAAPAGAPVAELPPPAEVDVSAGGSNDAGSIDAGSVDAGSVDAGSNDPAPVDPAQDLPPIASEVTDLIRAGEPAVPAESNVPPSPATAFGALASYLPAADMPLRVEPLAAHQPEGSDHAPPPAPHHNLMNNNGMNPGGIDPSGMNPSGTSPARPDAAVDSNRVLRAEYSQPGPAPVSGPFPGPHAIAPRRGSGAKRILVGLALMCALAIVGVATALAVGNDESPAPVAAPPAETTTASTGPEYADPAILAEARQPARRYTPPPPPPETSTPEARTPRQQPRQRAPRPQRGVTIPNPIPGLPPIVLP